MANDFRSRLIPIDNAPEEVSDFRSRLIPIQEGPSRGRSLISAPIKGAVKGAVELAQITDPLKALLGLSELNPHQQQAIERTLPTQDRPLEKGLQRAGRLAVSAAGGGESLLAKGIRTGVGAGLGQLAEEAGAPESIQGLAELSAFVSPKFGKKIIPKQSQKKAIDFLRGEGLTEEQITPLIKSDNFINRSLFKISSKGKKAEKLAEGMKSALGSRYDILKESGSQKFLKGVDVTAFDDKLHGVLEKINPRFSRLIEKDVESLRNKGISQKNLIDFYQDINAVVGKQEGGKAVLNILKNPIIEGLHKIDPESARKFTRLNEFYAKSRKFSKSIKPGIVEKVFSGTRSLATLGSIAMGQFGFLPKLIGTHAAQLLARELTTNPRLQNLSLQMAKSLSSNQIPAALRTFKIFQEEIRNTNKELSDLILDKMNDSNQTNQQ